MSVCNDTYVALGGGDRVAIAENPQSAEEWIDGVEALRGCERVKLGCSKIENTHGMQLRQSEGGSI